MSFDEVLGSQAEAVHEPAVRSVEPGRQSRHPVAGGLPQVSLLPRELRDADRNRRAGRGLVALVIVAALATAAATALAGSAAGSAQERLAAETARTQQLSADIQKFADLQQLQQRVLLGEAAVRVGSSTAIDWQAQMDAIEAVMPAGFTISTITADGATPIADYAQGTTPLEGPRAATISITAGAATIDELPVWLRELRSIPAYADVTPTITAGEQGAGFNVLLVIHLTADSLVNSVPDEAGQSNGEGQ